MRKLLITLLALTLGLSIAPDSMGQLNRRFIKRNNKRIVTYRGRKNIFQRYSSIGFSLNALNYFGDLSPLQNKFSTDIAFTRPGYGFSFSRCYGPRYTLIGQFMYGTLRGSDSNSAHFSDLSNGIFRYERNLSFRNRIKELSVVAVIDLFKNHGANYNSRMKWTPYAFIGLDIFLHNPQAKAPNTYLDGTADARAGQWVPLRPLGTEGQYSNLQPSDVNYGIKPYSLLQLAIPFGIGARFKLNDMLDLWVDVGVRYTFTDYLDDVSKNYVDLGIFKDPLAQSMSYRSNELTDSDLSNFTRSSYLGRDGKTYTIINGYGSEHPSNIRGNSHNNDIYMVTSIKVTRILGPNFYRAKFR